MDDTDDTPVKGGNGSSDVPSSEEIQRTEAGRDSPTNKIERAAHRGSKSWLRALGFVCIAITGATVIYPLGGGAGLGIGIGIGLSTVLLVTSGIVTVLASPRPLNFKSAWSTVPTLVLLFSVVVFSAAMFLFVFFAVISGGQPEKIGGQYVINNHGVLKVVSSSEFRVAEQRRKKRLLCFVTGLQAISVAGLYVNSSSDSNVVGGD